VDDDMVFTVEDVRNLLNTEGDIVSGLAVSRSAQPRYVVFDRRADGKYYFKDKAPTETQEVDATTLAFTKINMRVFDKLGTRFQFANGNGEDIDFCERASRAGYKITINPDVRPGHIYQQVLYAR